MLETPVIKATDQKDEKKFRFNTVQRVSFAQTLSPHCEELAVLMLYNNHNQRGEDSLLAICIMQTDSRPCLISPGPEYARVFGPGGVLDQARRRFVSARFSPRKPVACAGRKFYALVTHPAAPHAEMVAFGRPRMPLVLAA